jgi:hypothetical protein
MCALDGEQIRPIVALSLPCKSTTDARGPLHATLSLLQRPDCVFCASFASPSTQRRTKHNVCSSPRNGGQWSRTGLKLRISVPDLPLSAAMLLCQFATPTPQSSVNQQLTILNEREGRWWSDTLLKHANLSNCLR